MLSPTIDLQLSSLYRYVGAASSSLDITGILTLANVLILELHTALMLQLLVYLCLM